MIVFGAALAIRLIYLVLFRQTVMWDAMMVDAGLYDSWGMRIAGGDWIGDKVFYDPPLYAYFLGVAYKLFGHDYIAVRIIQVFIGSAHCVVVLYLAERILDRRAGIAAGLIASLYGPLVFYDALLMKAFLSGMLVDCALLVLLAGIRSGRPRWWFLHGIILGFASLLRVNLMAFVWVEALFFAAVIVAGKWESGRRKALCAALVWAVGVCAVVAPVMLRNFHVSGSPVLVSSYLGQNFYTGNNEFNSSDNYQRLSFVRANPKYEESDFHDEAAARLGVKKLEPKQVSDYWLRQGLLYIRAQPWDFAKRLTKRFRIFWNAYEVPDSYNFGFMSRHLMPVLRYLPGFGIIAPLGLLGITLTLRRRRELWPFYVFILLYCSSVIVFFVFSRYRMPVVGSLSAFAGAAIISLWDLRSNRKKLLMGAALLVPLAVFVNLPPEYLVPDSSPLRNLGTLYQMRGDADTAIDYYRKSVESNPNEFESRYFMAHTLRQNGEYYEAIKQYSEALRIKPGDPNALAGIGMCHDAMGNDEAAYKYYVETIKTNMNLSEIRIKLIELLLRNDKLDEAFREIFALQTLDKTNPESERLYNELKRKRASNAGKN